MEFEAHEPLSDLNLGIASPPCGQQPVATTWTTALARLARDCVQPSVYHGFGQDLNVHEETITLRPLQSANFF